MRVDESVCTCEFVYICTRVFQCVCVYLRATGSATDDGTETRSLHEPLWTTGKERKRTVTGTEKGLRIRV